MDDTFADESGIPALSNADDIPVHSTPIKGGKVPLPSTKNVMRALMSKHANRDDYEESLQAIHDPDRIRGHPNREHQQYSGKPQLVERRNDQDLSFIDNLRPSTQEHPSTKAFHHERQAMSDLAKNKVQSQHVRDSENKGAKNIFKSSLKYTDGLFSVPNVENSDNIAFSSSRHRDRSVDDNDKQGSKSIRSEDNTPSSRLSSGRHEEINVQTKARISTEFLESPKSSSPKSQTRLLNKTKETERDAQGGRKHKEVISGTPEMKRPTIHSPRAQRNTNKSLSKQNTSLCELENMTLQKQRAEIQLLVGELRDRDRELSDMMAAHQQQLTAWEQDRARLTSLDKKCAQYEEDLRSKTDQLRDYISSIRALKTREVDTLEQMESLRGDVSALENQNSLCRAHNTKLKERMSSLEKSLKDMTVAHNQLQTKEQELSTTLRTKEKDISSATSQMKELSERLRQLDLRCKECQDRELEKKRQEVVRLAEENRSARQQLALVQKEAGMMERCKDELIESIKVKQERTDSQLKNYRQLYERQLNEVASLQLQLDTTKEARQQSNQLDTTKETCQHSNQQVNSSNSYQGKNSQMSEYSWERQPGNQHSSQAAYQHKYRESDTHSSGYQSQIIENQTGSNHSHGGTNNKYHGRNQSTGSDHLAESRQAGVPQKFYKQMDSNHTGYPSHIQGIQTQGSRPQSLVSDGEDSRRLSDMDSLRSSRRLSDLEDNICSGRLSFEKNFRCAIQKPAQISPQNSRPETVLNGSYEQSEGPSQQTRFHHQRGNSPRDKTSSNIQEERRKKSSDLSSEQNFQFSSVPNSRSTYCVSPVRSEGYVVIETEVRFHQNTGNATNSSKTKEGANSRLQDESNYCQSTMPNGAHYNVQENTKSEQSDSCVSTVDSKTIGPDKPNYGQDSTAQGSADTELERPYTFENKLTSFLEDLDDIDDSIWNDKPINIEISTISQGDSSPASKLRKLLVESQQMINNLERSAESPARNGEGRGSQQDS
ncbi:CCD62-like protein [Mya arenaria]|uniref:CCD62-like protein n=1 Tax=Mya arenaria TaxID=6604 RepID=A0ABY7E4B7_MYAAR|nr:CCD62-like protein [Mya arenaria]